jgi:hypothetical protein
MAQTIRASLFATATTGGPELALRDALESLLWPWEARLGLAYRDGIRTEHWTRIKALTRRFANAWVTSTTTCGLQAISSAGFRKKFPGGSTAPRSGRAVRRTRTKRMAALNPVRSAVFNALHELVKNRLADQRRGDWLNAYTYSGPGSGSRRAGEIRRIYEDSAPPISSAMKPPARAFLGEVVGIVKGAVEKSGGHFEVSKAA